jgi:GntR family transcriptional regulator, transcriptional repressor for pyruvate dehydrogenase complex
MARASSSDPRSSRSRETPSSFSALPQWPRIRVADEIIQFLLQQIASRALSRGSRLPSERELSEQFGVSQPTIREAIRALDAMGLVEARHGSGVYVTGDPRYLVSMALRTLLQLERVTILDVLDVREVLGLYSSANASTAATPDDVAKLDELATALEDLNSATTIRYIAELVVEFQTTLSAAAHNPLLYALESFLIGLLMQFQLAEYKRLDFWKEWTLRFADDRRRIVDALRVADGSQIEESMRRYLGDLRDVFASDPAFSSVRLSDPKSLRTVADITISIPGFPSSEDA